jgi:hypothetical protein
MGEINLISHLKNRLKTLKPLRTTTRSGDEGGGEGPLGRNHQILRRRAEEEERSAGFGSSPPHARTGTTSPLSSTGEYLWDWEERV